MIQKIFFPLVDVLLKPSIEPVTPQRPALSRMEENLQSQFD